MLYIEKITVQYFLVVVFYTPLELIYFHCLRTLVLQIIKVNSLCYGPSETHIYRKYRISGFPFIVFTAEKLINKN